MASVTYRKVGPKWHIRFREKGKKEIIKTIPGTLYEKSVAQKVNWYKEQMALERINPWADGEDAPIMVVDDALDEYLFVNLKNGNWAKDSTHKTNKNVLKRMLLPIQSDIMGDKTPQTLFQHLFEILPGGAYTKKGDCGRINGFLKYCHQEGYLTKGHKVQLPMEYKLEMRNTQSIKYITWDQLHDVCKAVHFLHRQTESSHGKPPEFYTDIYWFMFYSLLRKEEIPKLTAGSLKGKRLSVQGKGRRTDIITLPPPALEIARKYAKGKASDEPLFLTHMNRPEVHLGNAIELALGEDHPSKGFHQLRHGGVVYYMSNDIPVQFVSKLARHKSLQVTLTVYGDILPDRMDEVFSKIEHKPFT